MFLVTLIVSACLHHHGETLAICRKGLQAEEPADTDRRGRKDVNNNYRGWEWKIDAIASWLVLLKIYFV